MAWLHEAPAQASQAYTPVFLLVVLVYSEVIVIILPVEALWLALGPQLKSQSPGRVSREL